MNDPRRFRLTKDGSTVAHGVIWGDDSCSVRWYGDKDHFSTVHWPNSAKAIANAFMPNGAEPYVLVWVDNG